MTRSDPFQGGIFSQEFLVEDNLFILPTQLSKTRLQNLADRPKCSGDTPNSIHVLPLSAFLRVNACQGSCLDEEVLNHFGN